MHNNLDELMGELIACTELVRRFVLEVPNPIGNDYTLHWVHNGWSARLSLTPDDGTFGDNLPPDMGRKGVFHEVN